MSPAAITAMLNAKLFEPFTIHTGDGSSVDVLSKEFTLLYPGGRTLRVVAPLFRGATEEGDFEEHKIDVFLITKVTSPPRNKNGTGPKRRKAG